MKSKIVTLTLNPALDKSTTVLQLVPEQKLRCTPMRFDAGGGGVNVSKAIHRLGGQGVAVFPSGGQNGATLCHLLEKEGVITQPLTVPGETRENISVLETAQNAQYRFTLPGLQITEKQADACLDIIQALNPDYLEPVAAYPLVCLKHIMKRWLALQKKMVSDLYWILQVPRCMLLRMKDYFC